MKHLAGLTNLQWLVLAGLPITDTGMKHLAGLKDLQRLNLGGLPITAAGLHHLAGLKNLRELQFGSEQVTDAVLECLVQDDLLGAWSRPTFDERSQSRTGSLEATRNSQIFALDLRQSKVTIVGLQHLKELKNLRRLGLRSDQLTVAGLRHLAGLKKLNLLLYEGVQMTDELLAVLHQNGQIHVLSSPGLLNGRAESDEEIVSLVLWGITDTGLGYIAGLKNLQHLEVGGPGITDEGLKHLARLTRLRTLNLHRTGNPDPGAAHRTQVTDDGLKHLAGLTNLEELDLSYLPITDAGLMHLPRAEKLRSLYLRGTKVTREGVRAAKATLKLPGNCNITLQP
jgi:internalin A